MFSEDWDLNALGAQASRILQDLAQEGCAGTLNCPKGLALPASSNIHRVQQVLIVCSGYPERAGVWSYTLLEKSQREPDCFKKTSMAPYFRDLAPTDTGLVLLNPNAPLPANSPEAALEVYFEQLEQAYAALLKQSETIRIILYGFSLGGDALLRFLQGRPERTRQTHGLVFVDPSPPHLGRRKLDPAVVELVDRAIFYGKGTADGLPDEFAEAAKMRLKITPILLTCEYHGEMPNLVWSRLFQTLPSLF